MAEHPFLCPNEKTIESHGREIAELYAHGRDREARMNEIETTLFGAERNGGGYLKMHAELHEAERKELRETLEVLRKGQDTQAWKADEQGRKLDKLSQRDFWGKLMEFLKVAAPIAASAAALLVAVK